MAWPLTKTTRKVKLLSPHRLDGDRIITIAIRGISGTHRNHLATTGDHLGGPLAREPNNQNIWEKYMYPPKGWDLLFLWDGKNMEGIFVQKLARAKV